MTKFEDGPAQGNSLMLKRAPIFLRVVVNTQGEWDALDQLDDHAHQGESLYAYTLTGEPGMCHILRRSGPKGGSGFYVMAAYRFVTPQPSDAEMRDNTAWREWTIRNREISTINPQPSTPQ
ncbi:MAG TPA: hypothetical protein VK961_06890 [Chthoniobacter sp.]|nr:hypothetical protein [Chthoniobacter sp.]